MSDPKRLKRRFLRYLKLERGYSPNTIEAYTHDIDYLLKFLQDEHLALENVRLPHLEQFAARIYEFGVSSRSQARIISGVRSFFRYLVLDGEIEDDPSELLESPSRGVHLPEVLSVEEVESSVCELGEIGRASCRERVSSPV